MNWLTLAVMIGATLRLTRLITHDTITAPLRAAAARRDARQRAAGKQPTTHPPGPGRWLTFLTCPWCISVWVSALVFGLYAAAPDHCKTDLGYVYGALTASLAAGLVLASRTETPQ